MTARRRIVDKRGRIRRKRLAMIVVCKLRSQIVIHEAAVCKCDIYTQNLSVYMKIFFLYHLNFFKFIVKTTFPLTRDKQLDVDVGLD